MRRDGVEVVHQVAASVGKTSGEVVFVGPTDVPGDAVAGAFAESVAVALEQLSAGLLQHGQTLDDVIRLWLWTGSLDVEDEAVGWALEQFPDPTSRPTVSVLVKDELPPDGAQLECLAVRGGTRRSVYLDGDDAQALPAGVEKGGVFGVGPFTGRAPGSATFPEQADEQAEAIFRSLAATADALDVRLDDLAHMLVWYRDHSVRDIVNQPFKAMFPVLGDRPARHSVIRQLPTEELLRVEAVGVVGGKRVGYSVQGAFHAGIARVPNSLPFGTGSGPLLFSAATYGRLAWVDDSGTVVIDDDPDETVESQIARAIDRTEDLVRGAGLELGDVVHVFAWATDPTTGEQARQAWRERDPRPDGPAWHSLHAELPARFAVQLEVVAARSAG